jgi:23S rRNA pseudouridine1911/1915/1917 synthase
MLLKHTASRDGKLVTFLRSELGLSATLTKRLKSLEACQVNGECVSIYHRVHVGDTIAVTIEEQLPNYTAEQGELNILYEDDAIIVLDKPAGITMHPTANRETGTLSNRLVFYYQQTEQKCHIHLVNRLDRDTFGVVLIAKNAHVHAILSNHLDNDRILKIYHAAVFGHPKAEGGVICHPIARLSSDSLLRCVREDGQYAKTVYKVLQTKSECSLLHLEPQTGRTHQLRLHCAYEGFPILGDSQYGTEQSQVFSVAHDYQFQQLCAVSLTFPHPMTGESMTVTSKQDVNLPG